MSDHDLHRYMKQVTDELAGEYERIRSRTQEDPGTAGDEGEENWAGLLRRWLPPAYHVATKGRLLAHDGSTSGQVDVIVLRPSYPMALREKKHYLLGGVAAAFECKTTLRSEHLRDAADHCRRIKSLPMATENIGSPWQELRGKVVYGVLAHSHEWQRPGSDPKRNVTNALVEGLASVDHPSEMIDLVTVADLGSWHSSVMLALPQMFGEHWPMMTEAHNWPNEGAVDGMFFEQQPLGDEDTALPSPVGVALVTLYERLAEQDVSLRPLADYMRLTDLYGTGRGFGKPWPLDVLSDGVSARLRSGHVPPGEDGPAWGEWRTMFF